MLERLDFGERGGLIDRGCGCDLEGGGGVDSGEIQLEVEIVEFDTGEVGEVNAGKVNVGEVEVVEVKGGKVFEVEIIRGSGGGGWVEVC
jgi:hypothetical protein